MKLRISVTEKDQYGNESTVKEWTVVTDSVNRALQMYEDELDGRKMQRLEYEIMKYSIGQKAKISYPILKKYCPLEPYLHLVKQAQKNGEGFVEIVDIPENRDGYLTVSGWKLDFLHYVDVPVEALIF